jgi:hypothetical protein
MMEQDRPGDRQVYVDACGKLAASMEQDSAAREINGMAHSLTFSLVRKGYCHCVTFPKGQIRHRITFLKGQKESASELLPRVHLMASLLKRWLLGTHQGAVSREHLDYYLDEFTFRFNRRNSRSRGKLFLRLAEQAVALGPAPYKSMVKCFAKADGANHNI